MKFEFEVDENEVLAMLQEHFDSRITLAMVKTHVCTNLEVMFEAYQKGIIDTLVRENCAHALSKALTGQRWPTFGNDEGFKKTHRAAWEAAMTA